MKKVTKLLSVFLIAGAVGTGVAGISACSKKTPEPEHQHTAATQWQSDANGHWKNCTANDNAKLEEGAHVYDNDQDANCNTCGYTREVTPPATGFVVPDGVTGLVIEGIEESVTLSSTKTSHDIDKSAIKVYLVNRGTKVGEVPAANYELSLYLNGLTLVNTWTNLKDDADYVVVAELKDAKNAAGNKVSKEGEITISISNPVTGIALKSGTTTQAQNAVNSMTDWTFEATRANGDKFDVAADKVTVGVLDTVTSGTRSVKITYGDVEGTVEYTITASTAMVSQSYAMNFSYLSAADEAALVAGEAVSLQDDRFVVQSSTGGSVDSHNKEYNGKYFIKRLKVNGASTAKTCARYIKVHADGAGTITVIAYNNGGTLGDNATRGVELYSSRTVDAAGDIYGGKVGTTLAVPSKDHATATFSVTAAGDYYITCDAAMTFCYVQLDQLLDASSAQNVPLVGEEEVGAVEVIEPETSAKFKVGDTFNTTGYTVKATVVNKATCESEVKDVTATATFSSPDMSVPGKKEITVTYGGKSDAYTVTVESPVDGIYGIKASLAATVNTQVASETSKLTLNKDQIVIKMLGENAEASVTAYTLKVGTEEITSSKEFAVGEYTLTVTATITAGSQTATISDDIVLKVTVKPAPGSLANVVVGSTEVNAIKGTLTSAKDIVSNDNGRVFVTASPANNGGVVVEDNSKSYDDKSFSLRIKLGGEGTVAYRTVGVEVKTGATIVFYAMSSSSEAGKERDLKFMNGDGDVMTDVESTLDGGAMGKLDGAKLHKITYTVTAPGTYYFGSVTGGVNVYGVEIIYPAA